MVLEQILQMKVLGLKLPLIGLYCSMNVIQKLFNKLYLL